MQSPFRWYLERVQLCHEQEGVALLEQATQDLNEEEYKKIQEIWEARIQHHQEQKLQRRIKMGVISAVCFLVLGGAYFILMT